MFMCLQNSLDTGNYSLFSQIGHFPSLPWVQSEASAVASCSPAVSHTWHTVQMCLQLLNQRPFFNLLADLVREAGAGLGALGELIMCQFSVKAELVCTRWMEFTL